MIDLSNIGIDFEDQNKCFELENNSTNNSTNKINLEELDLEITRKCNYRCKHCGRGEAQNKTISKEIIDRLFDCIDNTIDNILITGGEPLLVIDMIEYFCNKLLNSKINVSMLEVITNGNVSVEANNRLLQIFKTLIKHKNIICSVGVSDDKFHAEQDKSGEYLKTYLFFKMYESSKLIVKLKSPFAQTANHLYPLAIAGNAKTLFNNSNYKDYIENDITFPIYKAESYLYAYGHRIPIINNSIPCRISISTNGDLNLYQIWEYTEKDKHSIGNIINDDIKTIVNTYNKQALVECYEEKNYRQIYNMLLNLHLFSDDLSSAVKKELTIYKYCFQRIFNARKIFFELFPNIPVKAIREHFKLISLDNWIMMLYAIYQQVYKGQKRFNNNLNKEWCNIFLSILEDKKTNLGEKYNLFSANKEYVKEYMIFHFGDLCNI
ncbi:radical SAM protein [Lachnoclostridium sp. MSJ-17]|uniref:radical SAM protein n=1 Tax=Lachnoclostridium sp. MSJ-17 TaxID=2841516 RepID=UPI001C0FD0F1|nr:radical SAM protein [Lachnoclostridium sp. MSJ-17]MBU5462774.1 radical SAM protein [Lachnoclostridium sp. MSJ-17]